MNNLFILFNFQPQLFSSFLEIKVRLLGSDISKCKYEIHPKFRRYKELL